MPLTSNDAILLHDPRVAAVPVDDNGEHLVVAATPSFGDRCWALVTGRPAALYGPVAT